MRGSLPELSYILQQLLPTYINNNLDIEKYSKYLFLEVLIMSKDNSQNLLYFEADSMKELYQKMEDWQKTKGKRLLSTNIQPDGELFCCIALSNPSEVIIVDGHGRAQKAEVVSGALKVTH